MAKNRWLRWFPAATLVLAILLAVPVWVFAQTGSVSGTVKDAETGETLPGANVVLVSPSGSQAGGAASDLNGKFTISDVAPGSYRLDVRFVGYETQSVAVTIAAGGSESHEVSLRQTNIEFDAIVTTASRKPEKVLEAPAAISVLQGTEIRETASPSSIASLRNTTGVDMAQTGIDRYEVVMRGFNNAFSGAAYVLTDYRKASVPSLDVNIHSIMPNPAIDIHQVEVVRGPGSALYGAGVDNGVIHYLSKDAFTHRGTTLEVLGGNRSTAGGNLRIAYPLGENVAFKITGQYAQADDWQLNANDPEDQEQLETDVEGVMRDYSYEKKNINGVLQFRLGNSTTLTATGGYSALTGTVLSGIGTLRADNFGYTYGQVRLQAGPIFVQSYLNRNNTGDSYIYNSEIKPIDNSTRWTNQAQYSLDLARGRQSFIFGVDYDQTRPKTENTINGRNEDNDNINEVGGYIHSVTQISPLFDAVVDLRLDHNNVYDNNKLSPRFALVYKPTNTHTFRGTFNRAFSRPGTNSSFLDIVARQADAALPIQIRGRGSAFGHQFERNRAFADMFGANSDLVATSLNPATLGADVPVGLSIEPVYGLVYQQLNAIPNDQLRQLIPQLANIPDLFINQLKRLLAPDTTHVTGFSQGVLGLLDISTQKVNVVNDAVDIAPLKETTTETFEFGYKGLVKNRLLLAVDVYRSRKENFVSSLQMTSPFVLVPTLAADLEAAMAEGITNNAVLAATLGALGFTPEGVAETIAGLAAGGLPSASTPVAIVETTDNKRGGPGGAPELMLAYRSFDASVSYYGFDASFQYIASDRFNFFGNVSWVSDDFWTATDLGLPAGTGIELALNAPAFKTKAGFSYAIPRGLGFNSSVRYIDGFPVRSGPYNGDVPHYTLWDVGVGYDLDQFAPGLRADLSIQNVLDKEHREFVGAPKIGRMAFLRLNYGF